MAHEGAIDMKQVIDRRPIRWTPRARTLGRRAELILPVLGAAVLLALTCAAAWMFAPGGVR